MTETRLTDLPIQPRTAKDTFMTYKIELKDAVKGYTYD
jgi:hypothetical protein